MRVVFSTSPVAATNRLPDGEVASGTVYFEAAYYDAGEDVPEGVPTVSHWLSTLPAASPLRVPTDGRHSGVQEAVIPRSVLEGLPRDGHLRLSWRWTRRGERR